MKTTFLFKKKNPIFVIRDEVQQIITGPQGPQYVRTPAKVVKVENGKLETDDQEVIARIRRDLRYGTSEITEVTQEDKEIIAIREEKEKEIQEIIKDKKSARKQKKKVVTDK